MSDVGFSWVDRMPWEFDPSQWPVSDEAKMLLAEDDDQIGANVD